MRVQEHGRARPHPRRFGRRGLLRSASFGAVGLASGFGFGCGRATNPSGSSGGSKPAPSSQTPKRGGVLNYAGGLVGSYDTLGTSFDPAIQTQFAAKGFVLFYERLLAYNLTSYDVEPELAQKWEQPSTTEYLFHLQPGIKWQNRPPVNGRPLTVDDILWSLERARTDDPKFYSRSLLVQVDKIEAPDRSTIRITTKTPDAGTLKKLSVDNLGILPREGYEKYPKPVTAEAVIGTGPFSVKSVEQGVGAEYVRNPDYWKPGLPYLDGLRTKHFADMLSAWAAFLAGQVDITVVPGSEVKKFIAQQGPGTAPEWWANDFISFLYPNTKQKPMDDPRVTRALRLLIDHDEFIRTVTEAQNGRGSYGSIFPPALAAWDLTADEYKQHLEWKQPKDDAAKEALSLLAAAGFSKDNPFRFTVDLQNQQAQEAAMQLVQAQWKRLGQGSVDVQLKVSDIQALNGIRASRAFTYYSGGHSAGMVEPDTWLSSTYRTGGSLNFMDFSDPQLDAMIDKQRAIFDEAQRKAAVKEIVLYYIDHGPSTIAGNGYTLDGVSPKVQAHLPENHLNGYQFQRVWLNA